MQFTENITKTVPVELNDGTLIHVEVSHTGREDVAFDTKSFKQVTEVLEGISKTLSESLEKIQPNKATVKFGMEFSIESGQLTAIIVKGASKANLEVTLEWNKDLSGNKNV